MVKRRLSHQQKRRIQNRHNKQVQDPGLPVTDELGPEQKGLIIAHYGTQLDVEALEGPDKGQAFRCYFRATIHETLVTGDQVIWRRGKAISNDENIGIIESMLPRKSVLQRPHTHKQLRPVAANIDRIFIVFAPRPTAYTELVDRYLVAAELSGIQAILVLNKIDLLPETCPEQLQNMINLYRSIDYEVIETSAKEDKGIDSLQNALKHHTSVFVGQSGVGKSSLVNNLIPDAKARVGNLSTQYDKGTHTTTNAQLFHLNNGGLLIDSPGIREFGLWHIEQQQLIQGFVEFAPFIEQCKFRDCQHEQEPGCALKKALEDGTISPARFNNYQRILVSLKQHQ